MWTYGMTSPKDINELLLDLFQHYYKKDDVYMIINPKTFMVLVFQLVTLDSSDQSYHEKFGSDFNVGIRVDPR